MNTFEKLQACVIAGLLAAAAFMAISPTHGQTLVPITANQNIKTTLNAFVDHTPNYSQVDFSGGVAGRWLSVSRHNVRSYDEKGFDPCYTAIESDFKPIVQKVGGKWQVHFVSEIAERLP